MVEIYWLQRIGALSDLFQVMWIATLVTCGLILIFAPIVYDCIKENELEKKALKVCKILVATFVIGVVGAIFTPSTKEMYAIYGIGGTIDYIKSNDKAKQLPDKCVDALTRYVDSIEKENKDNNE